MTTSPLVSVIIPCYNQGRYLSDAIESVLTQTLASYEIIVIDDGSSDDTAAVAGRYAHRVRLITQSNAGLSAARNRGLVEARGRFVQFLDADDAILPTKLAMQVELLHSSELPGTAYCNYTRGTDIDIYVEPPRPFAYLPPEHGQGSVLEQVARDWELRMSIPAHCFLFDRRLFAEHGVRFDISLPTHEDWDCWMSVLSLGGPTYFTNEVLAVYRISAGSMSSDLGALRNGFMKAIDKQLRSTRLTPPLKRILRAKRREMDACYRVQMGLPPPFDVARFHPRSVWHTFTRVLSAGLGQRGHQRRS